MRVLCVNCNRQIVYSSSKLFYFSNGIFFSKDYTTEWYTKLNDLDLPQKQKDQANLVFD